MAEKFNDLGRNDKWSTIYQNEGLASWQQFDSKIPVEFEKMLIGRESIS
jgi:hypothetical protein